MPRRKPRHPSALTDLPPLSLLRTILLLQLAYYALLSTLVLFTALVAGLPPSLSPVLDWRATRSDTTLGWIWAGVSFVGGGVLSTVVLVVLVRRSKLVVDFAGTVHGVHLLVVGAWSGLPGSGLWWGSWAGSLGMMGALGMWICRNRELKPISFGGKTGKEEGKGEGNNLEMQPLREGQEGEPV